MEDLVFSLFLVVDILGIVGAVLVAVPFFSESKFHRTLSDLGEEEPLQGMEALEQQAHAAIKAQMERFRPNDWKCVVSGLAFIALSYLLHIVGESIKFIEERHNQQVSTATPQPSSKQSEH
jgi:hypothetical protein